MIKKILLFILIALMTIFLSACNQIGKQKIQAGVGKVIAKIKY